MRCEDLNLFMFMCLFAVALGDVIFGGSSVGTAIFKQKAIQESGKVGRQSCNLTCTFDFSTLSTWRST